MAAYHWVDANICEDIPSTALQGGVDNDGHKIYVGKAYHNEEWIPAKVIPGKKIAYIAYDGEEIPVCRFKILCEQLFEWIPTSHGCSIPKGAVEGGKTSDGEILYIGRANHEGSQTIGKVHPSHGRLYIPYDGVEHFKNDFEVLVLRQ